MKTKNITFGNMDIATYVELSILVNKEGTIHKEQLILEVLEVNEDETFSGIMLTDSKLVKNKKKGEIREFNFNQVEKIYTEEDITEIPDKS